MPNTRITLANNVKQTQKTVLLIPSSVNLDPTTANSCKILVITAAKSKFKSKKASRVFNSTGRELITVEDWQQAVRNDVTLLVSKSDEDFIGNTSKSSSTLQPLGDSLKRNCSIVRLNRDADVDGLSLKQLETTANTLPGIIHAVAQPDLHPGTKYPIGGVFVSEAWIHPPLIGGDIGCGMAWYRTSLSASQVEGDKSKKIADKLRGLEGSWRTQAAREAWLQDGASSVSAGMQWDESLGTIGAGNHFAELQLVEDCNSKVQGMKTGDVVLLVHSGSRGFGSDVLKRYTQNGQESLPETEAQSYLTEHDRACIWASRNRDLIALRFLSLLEPGNSHWDLGSNDSKQKTSNGSIEKAFSDIGARKVVDIWHNNIERVLWPPTGLDEGKSLNRSLAYVHRKGAAPTFNPDTKQNLDVLPLPGSRATPTLILHPTFSSTNEYGKLNALSLAHGAGRARSRADAQKYVAEKYKGRADDLIRGDYVRVDRQGNKKQDSENGRDVHGGTWVVCEDKQLVWEEAGEAYKDVWAVGDDLVKSGCAEIWGWCRGRISYKVRKD